VALAVLGEKRVVGTMTLAELAEGIPGVRVVRGGERAVSRVRIDSRRVEPGDLFVAVPGLQQDGGRYAADALERGAVGVLAREGAEAPAQGAWLTAADPRLAAARLAARAFGNPSERIAVLGVTGTNGKTTTTYLVRSIWTAAGRKSAVLGTLGVLLPRGAMPQARTTPEAPDLQETLARAADEGAEVAAMEVSSHALDLRRVDGTSFAAAAFLNLTPEHLDWHGTLEEYGRAKLRLFSELLAPGSAPAGPRAIVNGDDPWAGRFRAEVEDALVFAAGGGDAEVTAHGIRLSLDGAEFTLTTPAGSERFLLPLPGRHNVENALAAASFAHVMGISLADTVRGLAEAKGPAGRFERVHRGTFAAYVDYAHTEDGIRRAIGTARSLTRGRVIVVLGCGGNRWPEKRPVMGGLAAELADRAVFTTDNPRDEDPRDIVAAMLVGAAPHRDRVEVVMDREEALARAVDLAGPGDVVLALGKGHETVQSIAGVDHPFPEREILARVAASRDGRRG
jgi:UDP-N-acetylmuramoyl-L-alanyl-D-glutamate--2,6-diaminopimelate ligase